MSAYTNNYQLRYGTPSVQQQIEVAVVTAAQNIIAEDPGTTDHANRVAWANWALGNSSVAWNPFAWDVAMNSAIQTEIAADPSGQSIKDSDVQFVVNSFVEGIITNWVANPPPNVKVV